MITRIWRGWTSLPNAPLYPGLLLTEIFPAIEQCKMPDYHDITLLTIMQSAAIPA